MNKPCSGNRNAKIQQIISVMLIGAAFFLGGCATTGVTEQQNSANKADPYENLNRKVFVFNDTVDDYVAAPISDAYKWITPQFMQTGVFNFFSNLKNINVVINDVLQAKYAQSAHDTGRFALNTTLGLGGFVDVAKSVGLEQNDEDFEQTLAVWGVPQGSYLVIPFLGPSTVRGVPGAAFDTAANPVSYVGLPVQLISLLNTRANAEGALKFIDEAALDPYVFTRESFLQWRSNLATDGKSESSLELDDALGEDGANSSGKGGDTSADNKTAPTLHENTGTK
ncbi:MAG: VacJ family lipoprotein [Methylococcaceae bacterium]|nr:VacJ family lipoprotein [Methylococcaceae bacterium]OYV23239.1 MAG: lipoprotein [Methylococcaceae bacterium NSO1]